jgi:hypothetical protein
MRSGRSIGPVANLKLAQSGVAQAIIGHIAPIGAQMPQVALQQYWPVPHDLVPHEGPPAPPPCVFWGTHEHEWLDQT